MISVSDWCRPRLLCAVYHLDNGWLLESEEGVEAYTMGDVADGSPEEAAAKQAVLWAISDLLGPGSRYDAARVRIVIEPGDKWADGQNDSDGREETGD